MVSVGKLSHASKVIQPGKTFLRQLFEVVGGARKSFHHIRLNAATRSDIAWWATFAQAWNGISLIKEYGIEHVDHCVATDASGRFGCGGLWQNKWFQIEWKPEYRIEKGCQLQDSIMLRELLPVVIAGAVWGPQWRNSFVKFYCDNEGAVAAINSGYSKIPSILHLLRCLFFSGLITGYILKRPTRLGGRILWPTLFQGITYRHCSRRFQKRGQDGR